MAPVTIYHNPRCSKSRQALAYVEETGNKITVVEYLKDPLSKKDLLALLKKIGKRAEPADLVRTGEKRFKELGLSKDDIQTADAVAKLLAKEPVLMQRPVIVSGSKATIARSEDALDDFFS